MKSILLVVVAFALASVAILALNSSRNQLGVTAPREVREGGNGGVPGLTAEAFGVGRTRMPDPGSRAEAHSARTSTTPDLFAEPVFSAVGARSDFQSRYTGLTSEQLLAAGGVLNQAYAELKQQTAMRALRDDPACAIDVSNGLGDYDWAELEFTRIEGPGRSLRVIIDREHFPDVYALREEVRWVFAERQRRFGQEGK